jgi:Mg2+/Co2+ transporter CorC
MTLIDGDRIITAQLYDDEHEEFTEKQMSIIEYVDAYTTEGVTTADDVLDKIKAEIEQIADAEQKHDEKWAIGLRYAVKIIDKYKAESEE